jgi:hypothetical protein
MDEQNPGQGERDYGDVASVFPMEGTMRAPIPTPEGLPVQSAIIIMGACFIERMSALRAEIREAALAWLAGDESAERKRFALLAELREVEKENDDA